MPWLGGFYGVRVVLVAMALAIMLVRVGSCGTATMYHAFLLLFGLGYPYALRLASVRLERRRRWNRVSLMLDGLFAGALVPAVGYDAVPSVVLLVISLFNWMAVGGVFLSAVGALVLLAGVGVSAAVLDLPAAGACPASNLLAYAVLLLYLPFVAWVVFRYSAALRHYCDSLQADRDGARAESRKAAQALLAVLPPSAAAEFTQTGRLDTRALSDGTLLLVDVGAATPGEPGIDALGEIFTVCDDIAGRHGLEGVKTLGRRYLALAAGLAGPDQALAAAREIAAYFRSHGFPDGRPDVRLVVHCGAATVGLVQPERLNYDLAGPAVDEMLALAGRGGAAAILVSQAARARLSGAWNWQPAAGDGPPAFVLAAGEVP